MFFYIWNPATELYEGGGYTSSDNIGRCNVHVPEGCELIWSEIPLESQ